MRVVYGLAVVCVALILAVHAEEGSFAASDERAVDGELQPELCPALHLWPRGLLGSGARNRVQRAREGQSSTILLGQSDG